jgi:hypothetical protein
MGYGAGALVDHLRQRLGKRSPGMLPAPAPAPATHSPAELAAAHGEINQTLNPQAAMQHFDQQLAKWQSAPRPVQMGHLQEAKMRAGVWPRPVPLPMKVGFAKVADYSLGTNIGPVGVGTASKDERLMGMNRWVPRSTIEDAYQGLQQGLDERALREQAAESGNLMHPAVGAGLATALAHFGLPGNQVLPGLPGSTKALAALGGAGAGALYNRLTGPRRADEMSEAIKGVQLEQQRHPRHVTSREATPMVVSPAGDH